MAFNPGTALAMIKTAMAIAETATRAMEAANNGHEEEAELYLRTARERYTKAVAEWDSA